MDLSHWDANVDPEALEIADFLIVKMGGSDGGEIYLDPTFADRVQLGWNIDKPVLCYWMEGPYYWITTSDARTLDKTVMLQ